MVATAECPDCGGEGEAASQAPDGDFIEYECPACGGHFLKPNF